MKRGAHEVIGNVSDHPCEHPKCLKAIEEGRAWHATPMGFAVTLPENHFTNAMSAIMAIHHAMEGIAGRDMRLSVAEDTKWRLPHTDGVGMPD